MILRQVLTESVLLAIVGGIAGLLLAVWGTDLLLAIAPRALPRVHDITLDWRVVTFTTFVTIGTGILFGLLPAIQLSTADLNGTLKDGGRSVTGSGGGNRTRSALVIAEVALSLVLLAGAGLLSATLLRLQGVDPGFDSHNVLTAGTSLPDTKYKTDAQQAAFYDLVLDKVRTIPGVEGVAGVSILPLDGSNMLIGFALEGEPRGDGVPPAHGEMLDIVTTDFFSVMKVPVKAGRLFTAQDDSGGAAGYHRQRGLREKVLARAEPSRKARVRGLQQRHAARGHRRGWRRAPRRARQGGGAGDVSVVSPGIVSSAHASAAHA